MQQLWIAIALEYYLEKHNHFCMIRSESPIPRADFFGAAHPIPHSWKIAALQFMRIID